MLKSLEDSAIMIDGPVCQVDSGGPRGGQGQISPVPKPEKCPPKVMEFSSAML